MERGIKHNGFAIALAWPETMCKQVGAWYDPLMRLTGFNKDGYYHIGHSAVLLVDDETKMCQYFDFGRYHSPHGHGRVRSAETDHDLRLNTKAQFSDDASEILNLGEILTELYTNPSTHGTGTIKGAATRINFDKAVSLARKMQEKDFLPYGVFERASSNCSRFVNRVLCVGKPTLFERLKLQVPLTVSPSPAWNLFAVSGEVVTIGQVPAQEEIEDYVLKPQSQVAMAS